MRRWKSGVWDSTARTAVAALAEESTQAVFGVARSPKLVKRKPVRPTGAVANEPWKVDSLRAPSETS